MGIDRPANAKIEISRSLATRPSEYQSRAKLELLRNSRKTERGTKQFLIWMVVRAAPFALMLYSR
jgi:hypothetical protein